MKDLLAPIKERLEKAIPTFPPDAIALMIDNCKLVRAVEVLSYAVEKSAAYGIPKHVRALVEAREILNEEVI